jgi:hypothetical protein
LCLKCSNKNEIYMYTVEHDNVFISLVANSLGRYDRHHANAVQNLQRLVTCNVYKCQVVWDPTYINISIC